MKRTQKTSKEQKVRLCPKCGNQRLDYSPGIDIGMIYAICHNCGYKANQNMFPDLTKKEAKEIKMIKGNKLMAIYVRNTMINRTSRWVGIIVVVVFAALLLSIIFQ